MENITCLESSDTCSGAVEYREPMSPTGKSYPRCDKHNQARVKMQERLSRRYDIPMYY